MPHFINSKKPIFFSYSSISEIDGILQSQLTVPSLFGVQKIMEHMVTDAKYHSKLIIYTSWVSIK